MAFNLLKKKKKQDFTVKVLMVVDLVGFDGKEVVLRWRRGKKEGNKGKFSPFRITGARTEVTNVTLNLHCTLFEKSKAGFYEEKLVEFILETKEKKRICAGIIDLAQFADLAGKTEETLTELRTKQKVMKGKLMISISSVPGEFTGESENTEVLMLSSEDTSLGNVDPIHGRLIMKMREKEREDHEEEELRKKQIRDRDEAMKAERLPEVINKSEEDMKEEENVEEQEEEHEVVKEEKEEAPPEPPKIRDIDDAKQAFSEGSVTIEGMILMLMKYQEEDAIEYVIGKWVEEVTKEITPVIESCLFSERNVFQQYTNDIEESKALTVLQLVKKDKTMLENKGIKEEIVKKAIKQEFHFLGFYVVDNLFNTPDAICCVKGFQFKFFMSYIDLDLTKKDLKDLKALCGHFEVITDVANLFMLHHSIKLSELENTFPLLSINIIYQLLRNFKVDEMDNVPIDQKLLEDIQNKCTNDPLTTRFTSVA
ncbi:hypothetical protein EIN_186580 [Entamoeba invadens IP1]|uniref:hypothetical protein n=1 Tax=Entamoeba invadens IP1 TaxID=370355 RepID=UPI0002C3E6E3|nr:hypothetical protein EIN_186580 [Entamoeba invadens IP1]ELP94231.1 hypothetical protein EIN_186580 [Entamoeba invadens IP1]|eukprot:XP_004261002.1 hypothetical protein EIN_186580 [Entamoeba invadens IP1]